MADVAMDVAAYLRAATEEVIGEQTRGAVTCARAGGGVQLMRHPDTFDREHAKCRETAH